MGNFRGCVMSSCIKPIVQQHDKSPVVLLHCFDRFVLLTRDKTIPRTHSLCQRLTEIFSFVGLVHVLNGDVLILCLNKLLLRLGLLMFLVGASPILVRFKYTFFYKFYQNKLTFTRKETRFLRKLLYNI